MGESIPGSPLNGQANLIPFPEDERADTFLTLAVLSQPLD